MYYIGEWKLPVHLPAPVVGSISPTVKLQSSALHLLSSAQSASSARGVGVYTSIRLRRHNCWQIFHLVFVLQLLASLLSPGHLLPKTTELPLVLVILQDGELGGRTKGGATRY